MRLSGYAVAITVSIGVVLSATPASAQLDFTWSPVVPEIGETVVFTLTGVTGTIETATWTMGGIGCDGASATQICGPLPPWSGEDCSQFSFKYASAGSKSVSVILDLAGGGNDRAGPLTVNVANSGSCDVVTPSISFRPSNPNIGENVLFTINGVPADIDKASWSMGATGCDGADPTPECFPSLWNDCKTQAFKYASQGTRTVNLTIEVGGNVVTAPPATITISSTGSCEGATAVGITWNPTVPEIGEKVTFEIVGVSGDVRAEWDFGGPGCDVDQIQICNPLFSNCHAFSHTYSSSGGKTVNLTVTAGGSVIGAATNSLTVADVGTCDDGGGGCSYTLSKYSASFPPDGGSGSFDVSTTAECTWITTTTSSWLTIDSSDGTGHGSVAYTVDANGGLSSRTATIKAAGKIFRVNQTADQGDTAAARWRWTGAEV